MIELILYFSMGEQLSQRGCSTAALLAGLRSLSLCHSRLELTEAVSDSFMTVHDSAYGCSVTVAGNRSCKQGERTLPGWFVIPFLLASPYTPTLEVPILSSGKLDVDWLAEADQGIFPLGNHLICLSDFIFFLILSSWLYKCWLEFFHVCNHQ